MKKNKHKEHKEHKEHTIHKEHKKLKENSANKTTTSIIIGAVLIILATFIYRFEIAGKIFYLRYFVTLIATAILFDALNLKYKKNIFHNLKLTSYILLIFLTFILIYVIITLP